MLKFCDVPLVANNIYYKIDESSEEEENRIFSNNIKAQAEEFYKEEQKLKIQRTNEIDRQVENYFKKQHLCEL